MITIGMIIISLLRTYKLCCSLGAKSNCMNRDTHFKDQCRSIFFFLRDQLDGLEQKYKRQYLRKSVDVVIANK